MLTLLAPLFGSGGLGILVRVLLPILRGVITRKNNRENAINSRIADSEGTFTPCIDDDSIDTANHIVLVMCYLFATITLVCLCFPNAEYKIFLPETVEKRSIDFIFFSYAWHSDLGHSVLTINSGGIVYIAINFCIFIITAFFKGNKNGGTQTPKKVVIDNDQPKDKNVKTNTNISDSRVGE